LRFIFPEPILRRRRRTSSSFTRNCIISLPMRSWFFRGVFFEKMNEVDIRWPNGEMEVLHDVPGDFIYTVAKGQGIQERMALPVLQ
jgi:hypothetical protein